MKRGLKTMLTCTLAACIIAPTATLLTGCGGSADKFTMWLSPNSDLFLEYGMDISKNPVMKYVENKFDIKFDYIVPQKGSEQEAFTTLTGGGDFPDVMDLTYYTGAAVDLVEDGVALDLTNYIYPTNGDSYFPNYKKVLDDDLDVKNVVRTLDNHYYSLATIDDEQRTPWGGYMSRKD